MTERSAPPCRRRRIESTHAAGRLSRLTMWRQRWRPAAAPTASRRSAVLVALSAVALLSGSCGARAAQGGAARQEVLPGISVLLSDSSHLLHGKRLGLLTNQTGIDERGRSDIDLILNSRAVRDSGARLISLFSPEHGIRGTEDRQFIESGRDSRTGLPIHSLYGATTLAPPDSTLREIDILIFDLQDIGTRTWTYVGNLVYALRAVERTGRKLIVLDRPNPLNGAQHQGPLLDATLSNAEEHRPDRPARPYALYPMPLRHGMTMGEMARFYNETLGINADLTVIPARGWRRAMWFDETGLPWVKPSPNMPSLTSALLYPALVAFEGSNLSVGRGTGEPFQRFGAPGLKARETALLLESLYLGGVRFQVDEFVPRDPTDRKFNDQRIPGVRIFVLDRDRVQVGRLAAAILWAVDSTSGDMLRLSQPAFDLRFGSPELRAQLMAGRDPDSVIDATLPAIIEFERSIERFLLYR